MLKINIYEIKLLLPDIIDNNIYNPVVITHENDEAEQCIKEIIKYVEKQGISYCCVNLCQEIRPEILEDKKIFIFRHLEKVIGCELLENNFFDIYNIAKTNNNLIIITVKKADINKLQERNKARLRSGITIEFGEKYDE